MPKQQIRKYQLDHTHHAQSFAIPRGAEVVHVDMQHGYVTFWAEVLVERAPENRTFIIVPTGEVFSPGEGLAATYVGTALETNYVWHLYEITGNAKQVDGG